MTDPRESANDITIHGYPNARDCEHGQLRRSCRICELEADYARLRAAAREVLSESEWGCDMESGDFWPPCGHAYCEAMAQLHRLCYPKAELVSDGGHTFGEVLGGRPTADS